MKTLIGTVLGLAPIAGICFFSLLVYDSAPSVPVIILSSLFIIASLIFGYKIFKLVQKEGVLNFISAINASPDLDEIKPNKQP